MGVLSRKSFKVCIPIFRPFSLGFLPLALLRLWTIRHCCYVAPPSNFPTSRSFSTPVTRSFFSCLPYHPSRPYSLGLPPALAVLPTHSSNWLNCNNWHLGGAMNTCISEFQLTSFQIRILLRFGMKDEILFKSYAVRLKRSCPICAN